MGTDKVYIKNGDIHVVTIKASRKHQLLPGKHELFFMLTVGEQKLYVTKHGVPVCPIWSSGDLDIQHDEKGWYLEVDQEADSDTGQEAGTVPG
jgi:hypothetical protein